jgi:tetratricopeptide (TPR) repeat protein
MNSAKSYNKCHQAELGKLSPFFEKTLKKVAISPNPLWQALYVDGDYVNILEKYQSLVDEEKWEDALPIIKEVVDRNQSIDTSWFNYGVCLDQTGNYSSAADAFIKAHELNVQDTGIHYRIFRSLFLANDLEQLYEFTDYLCDTFEGSRESILDSDEYKELEKHKQFKELIEK